MQTEALKKIVLDIKTLKTETQTIELKAATQGCPTRLFDTLSSFSNQDEGGIIIFGVDETDKTYDLENIQSVNTYKDCITIIHNTTFIHIGREPSRPNETIPLDILSVSLIAAVVLPVLRNNLHKKLEAHGVVSSLEYEHDGIIWGCDLKSKVFYSTFGYIRLHSFSDLRSVKEEDLSRNTLYDGNYVINIAIKTMFDFDDDIDLTFYSKDAKYYDMLTMFKEIKKRGYK